MVRRCTYSSIHFFVSRSRSVVDCALCGVVVCAMCVLVLVLVCAVVYVLRVCVGCAFCVLVLWCVRCVLVLRVLLVVWCGAAWHAENLSVCRFKTPPCVPGKRPHVSNMRAFSGYTRKRLERTLGGVLNLHTEGFSAFSSLVLSVFLALSSVCLSVLLSSLLFSLLFSLALFHLLSSLSSFSATMTMITRPVGSLCVHTALTCESVAVRVLWLIPCRANMFASCTKQLS